ncbi:PQQ-dependent sugar dehydrogenase [Chryseobacterium sp. POL2]|uniref:PQQ-dependent sugar dehydrogenase n=1 Tax=Chryseobacterium sp. POL2 TaxID=2713414 RepID=UPI0013E197A0|nr:PQQ-dependent sugar dehydrogenase [Chryseobacterium sp. POL2]QIG90053.1 PQQ-dependent sugar dehydrogenase [Chryseobacterium sp. POL2]
MKINIKISIFSILAILFSCESKSQNKNTYQNNSVETEKPNSTDLKPAFSGQTRIAAVKTNTAYKVETLNEKLGRPWGITQLDDGRFLITEKSGFLHLVSADGQYVKKIIGLPKVDASGQGGLLDVAVDPDFANNRILFWTFSEPFENGNLTSVAKGKLSLDETQIENPQVIFRATPSYNGKLHYGSRIVFDTSGHLFVSTGERSDKVTRPLAQDLTTYLGKIVRITKEGKAVVDNPFVGKTDVKPEIYSYGHRNVQGLAIDSSTGELWNSEFGPRGGDEINLIKPGKNYGWPDITYGIEYSGNNIGKHITQKEGMEQPVYYWDPVISPSGITFYTGTIDEWKNNLFLACLSGEHIDRIVIKDNKVVGEERLLDDKGERFRDILDGKDGNLYTITDSGKLMKISKK